MSPADTKRFTLLVLEDPETYAAQLRAFRHTVWLWLSGAALGVLQTLFWIRAPKVVTALLAIACGWCVVPYWSEAKAALTDFQMRWLVAGGVVYSVGAVFYAIKKPNPIPGVFGYHEMFHLCTLIAAVMHFMSVASIIYAAG